jgi:L-rhamnose mutarotase
VKLKPEYVEKYKECHARVWPEVLKQIKDCNIEDCESLCALVLIGLLCYSLVYSRAGKLRGIALRSASLDLGFVS